ncbi:Peptidoglycan-recognition protein LB [Eumeta japonica]|uniref:Peptidoglycan recognition protein n=1 Tax=Eumeta variegata TaxID=151549 RepID=A0A4C1UL35_EUMVA|nr:Peptidoglycan-recognition protein LB [Eumeta japonica]
MSKNIYTGPTFVPADLASNEIPTKYDFEFVTREEWGARTPKQTTNLTTPVPYVVIHHSYVPSACYTRTECARAMRSMQDFHMDKREWWDIGYNFAVGSDGVVYEGRGWTTLGAHSLHFNTVSIGICLIGDWTGELPPSAQLETSKALMKMGVREGYVKADYRLVGHRQVRDTECPGDALFRDVRTWEHFSPRPASAEELVYMDELPKSVRDLLNKSIVKN